MNVEKENNTQQLVKVVTFTYLLSVVVVVVMG